MNVLHFSWIEAAVLAPLFGAALIPLRSDPDRARRCSLAASAIALVCTVGAWIDLAVLNAFEAHDRWDLAERLFHRDMLVVDELSAPLLPLVALQFLVTFLATLRTKASRFSFTMALATESLTLATLACKEPWLLVALLAAAPVFPAVELVRRGESPRVFVLHMALFAILLVGGQAIVAWATPGSDAAICGLAMLGVAALVRSGAAPLHCWHADLFERASLGAAILFVAPMTGAYAALRLVLPTAPAWVLHLIALASLATAVYAAGMTLVQRDARRFFSFLLLSNSSLVLVGLELVTPLGLVGALCVWVSVSLALTGFGLALRSIESRCGRIDLARYHGMFRATPTLAGFFLLTGLASIGFPGTLGFVAAELLIEGAIDAAPLVGVIVLFASALNGLAVMHAYFRIFTGCEHSGTIDLRIRPAERVAVLALSLLILGGGLYPQPGVSSRRHAAAALLDQRNEHLKQNFTDAASRPAAKSAAGESPR
ncbi:MAG: oxidoreductase [Pirellulales bacterium]|nr:oxidoreductase [Pirellulales bacterium]